MQYPKLQDRIYYGLGAAARRAGGTTDAFRPTTLDNPLKKSDRFLRLHAACFPADGDTRHANGYGATQWQGVFDASYTQRGDYLVQDRRIFFIAAQQPLLPVVCVQTNRTISVSRPGQQTAAAANPYGGYVSTEGSILIDNWPASVIGVNGKGEPSAGLPTDIVIPYLTILLPPIQGVTFSIGDLVSDDLSRSAVIIGCELSELGWRISAKLATT